MKDGPMSKKLKLAPLAPYISHEGQTAGFQIKL